ncbi:MAG: toll/interleukin-1 receptor domain-containing protein, partial [Anaerolineae bacterium]|nr:toll/interleukin-1 receptor domain-containing protein [Anaerolineae bacterium]
MPTIYNFSDVFISYSRKDKPVAKKIADALLAEGYEIWADWEDIPLTVDWWNEIKAGIDAASTFAFLISPDSAMSDVCRQEVQYAVENHKRVIPILYREITDEQQEHLHPTIRTHNWTFFQDEDETLFEQSLQQLIQVFVMDVNYRRAHTRYFVRAKEWLERAQEKSFLLQGTDSLEAEIWLNEAAEKTPAPTPLHYQYIAACTQERLETEYMEKQQALLLFVERRAVPTLLISGGSAALFIFMTVRNKAELDFLNQLTIALGGFLINGLFMAAIGIFADDLVRIRFHKQFWQRFFVSTIYGLLFGSAISGVTQLVNYGVVGFHWPSIFIMGFFFGFGFALRTTCRFSVWIAAVVVALCIQFGALLTLGIGSNETSYFVDALRPVFHYFRFEDYFLIGFPMTLLQAVGVYA